MVSGYIRQHLRIKRFVGFKPYKRPKRAMGAKDLGREAGLVELADDDRATLYGAMLDLAAKAREDRDRLMLWKRRGKRAFDAEAGSAGDG